MTRLTAMVVFTIGMLVLSGCGGPGEPVTKRLPSDESSQDSGGVATDDGTAESAPSEPASDDAEDQGGRKRGQRDAAEDNDADDEEASSEAEGEASDSGAEKQPEPRRPPAGWIPGKPKRPAGLQAAFGGGSGGGMIPPKPAEEQRVPPKAPSNDGDDADDARDRPPRNPGNTAAADARRFTFFERANFAFSTGNETEGFQYLYAHAITEDGALSEHPIHWFSGLSEPRLALRWGVAIEYNEGRHEGAPPRFGDTSDTGTGRGGDSRGAGGALGAGGATLDVGDRVPGGRRAPGGSSGSSRRRDGGAPSAENPTELFTFYTSDFGTRFLNRIEMRRTTDGGYWGQALHDVDATKDLDQMVSRGGQSPAVRQPAGAGGGMLGASRSPRPPSGDDAGSSGAADTAPELPANFEPEFEADPNSLIPGVVMLGVMNEKTAIEAARAHGVDLLAFFDLKAVSTSRSDPKLNAKLRIIDVKTGEEVGESRQLSSIAYNKALADDRDNQIEKELDELFGEFIDEAYKSGDMIDIPDKYLDKRIEDLIEGVGDNPLPALVEITYYLNSNMISKQEYAAAAGSLIGPDNARMLVDGEIDDREKALRDWLPGQYSVNAPNADFR